MDKESALSWAMYVNVICYSLKLFTASFSVSFKHQMHFYGNQNYSSPLLWNQAGFHSLQNALL